MTQKQIAISASEEKIYRVVNFAVQAVRRPLLRLTAYYASVLERPVSPRQTLILLNAQVAAALTIFPTDAPWLLRTACCLWLVKALMWCKAEL